MIIQILVDVPNPVPFVVQRRGFDSEGFCLILEDLCRRHVSYHDQIGKPYVDGVPDVKRRMLQ